MTPSRASLAINSMSAVNQADLRDAFEYRPDGFFYWAKVRSGNINVGDRAGTRQRTEWRILFKGRTYGLARLVWLYHHGIFPAKIKYKNRDPHDSRLENLELR